MCELAGVPHVLACNWTGIDAPETWKYVHTIPNFRIEMPKKPMFQLIVELDSTFQKMLENRKKPVSWKTAEDVFNRWLYGESRHKDFSVDGQLGL